MWDDSTYLPKHVMVKQFKNNWIKLEGETTRFSAQSKLFCNSFFWVQFFFSDEHLFIYLSYGVWRLTSNYCATLFFLQTNLMPLLCWFPPRTSCRFSRICHCKEKRLKAPCNLKSSCTIIIHNSFVADSIRSSQISGINGFVEGTTCGLMMS